MIKYLHTGQDGSLTALIDDKSSILSPYSNLKSLLEQKGEDGRLNYERVWGLYTNQEKTDNQVKYPFALDLIKPGTLLYVENSIANLELLTIRGKDLYLKQRSFGSFIGEELEKLIRDPKYIPSQSIFSSGDSTTVDYVLDSLQVFIWIRSLQKIIDVSSFVTQLSTTVTGQSNTFSIQLNPISTDFNDVLKTDLGFVDFYQIEDKDKNFNIDFFTKHLQQNDMVFIRFEKLENEQSRKIQFEVQPNQIPNQIYDMIGLLDVCNTPVNFQTLDISVTIQGRDLTKMLLDDGSYFFPLALIEGSESFFINPSNDSKFLKRLFTSTEYTNLFSYSYRSIDDTIGFIINQLSNTGVIPDDLSSPLQNYQDKSKVINIEGGNAGYKQGIEVNGVWGIIKVQSDPAISDRRIVSSDIARPDGTLMDQVNKVCQMPFVEFMGDTYGDRYNFILRQPPFSKSQILDFLGKSSVIELVSVGNNRVSSFNLNFEQTSYSWYQIKPQTGFLGNNDFLSFAHLPAVYLEEYVANFGNKKMVVPLNYLSDEAFVGKDGVSNAQLFRDKISNDLKWLIETTALLPFTRFGQIVINGGDRRIKRGTWVWLRATDEICYVDYVNNNITVSSSIDRTTTLTVSRCMKRKYLVEDKKFNYFNIVNTELIGKLLANNLVDGSMKKSVTENIVNKDVFDFFLKRKQFND